MNVDARRSCAKGTDCFAETVEGISIAQEEIGDSPKEVLDVSKKYNAKISQLRSIKTRDIPVETLPKSASIHQAIELFDKINSQGTHLSDAELALAHMSAQWPQIRRNMKDKQAELAEQGFEFDLNFYVKCMIGALTETMSYEQVYDIPRSKLEQQWGALADPGEIFDYVVNVLQNEANIPSSDYINTRDVLIPFIVFLNKKDKAISHEEKIEFLRWMYAAMMWSRYSGSADSRVEHDLSLLESSSPTEALVQEIRDDRGRIEVQPSDLEGRGKRTRRFYNMVRIVTRANDPVDWTTGEPLVGSYKLESHHIFPKNKLYEKYDAGKSPHRKLVNEIANRAFITPQSNKYFGDQLPSEYLPEVVEKHPNALESQFIPENPELWKMENYEDFLAKRRGLLSEAINDYMEDLMIGTRDEHEETVTDMIQKGENARIEFKETLLYDVHRDQPNKELKSEVAKEICALANTEGGVVIIGVEDRDKEIKGLSRDYKLMPKGRDDFGLQLKQEISDRLGRIMSTAYTTVEFKEVEGKEVCVIYVEESPNPVYFSKNSEDKFYVRNGSASEPLNLPEANEFIQRNFA